MYEFTDKEMKKLTVKMVRAFSKLKRKSILQFDEVNSLRKSVNDCYKECYHFVIETYLSVAKHYYKECGGDDTVLTALFVEGFLGGYDPVTRYIFKTETDRKRARLFEALVASKDVKEVDKGLRLFHNQVKQWADEITDEARMKAFADTGIEKVRWKTEEDSRVCKECGELNNKVFPIGNVPDKPHIGCRCYFLPVMKP